MHAAGRLLRTEHWKLHVDAAAALLAAERVAFRMGGLRPESVPVGRSVLFSERAV
jgi:hypothetical protein